MTTLKAFPVVHLLACLQVAGLSSAIQTFAPIWA